MGILRKDLLLYAVTDRSWLQGSTLYDQVESALKGGATCLQLREKTLDRETLLDEARRIKALCARYGVPMILNDDAEIARAADADGVHVGQSDLDAERAREILGPDKIIGVSAHTVEQALAAQRRGADYLGVGAAFATRTKADAKAVTRETLKAICEAVSIPVVAIGGIGADNVGQLAGTGICGVAAVSAIFAQRDIQSAARELLARVREAVRL